MRYSIAQCVTLACLLEVATPKPGNVHRGADFDDLSFTDFLVSGVAIAPHLADATTIGVGPAILAAVQATRGVVTTNSNLGMILLLGPLAAVPVGEPLRSGVARVLATLTPADATSIWQAIGLAKPGGVGKVQQLDLADPPPPDILAAMKLAADRDLVAAQYVNGFAQVFDKSAPWLLKERGQCRTLAHAIVRVHLRLMAEIPDSLIARKAGTEVAQKSSQLARQVLESGGPDDEPYQLALADFDFWLRSEGRRRNPGTTADLIAAGLFVLLRDDLLDPPYG